MFFTLPHELSTLVLQNKRLLYDLLFRASAATMLEVARDPKHFGADIEGGELRAAVRLQAKGQSEDVSGQLTFNFKNQLR
jgi:hypothetical protein